MRRAPFFVILGLILMSHPSSSAQNPVTTVQRSLKDLGFFYGDASGNVDEETGNALRRFQIRAGLKPTGEIDNGTLQALSEAILAKPPEADGEPPSLRDRARRAEIGDREFSEQLNPPTAQALPSATAPVRSVPPPPEETRPDPPLARKVAPSEKLSSEQRTSGVWTPAKAAEFVRDYLRAAEAAQPDGEIAFYADAVDYFDSGRVSRQFVANDQAGYYRRWPNREFSLVGTPQLVSSQGPRATVRFRMRYEVSSAHERASGATENILQLRQEDDGTKITGIHERKIRE